MQKNQPAEAHERPEEQNRWKSEFLSTLSHELRTPLNTIVLLSHLIEREGRSPADDERRLHDLHAIRDSAQKVLSILDGLLERARLEAGQPAAGEAGDGRDGDQASIPSADGPATAGPSTRQPHRVLIVEDDEASRYGLKGLLETEGYEVAEAATLEEASRRLASDPPEVAVLDITMPDGDGAAWLASARGQGPLPCPFIALTGVTADEDRRRIERSGASAVLAKPVDVSRLFAALHACLVTP